MSLRTWMREFYPKKPTARMTTVEAIEHSLRKWEGARKKNTREHGVVAEDYDAGPGVYEMTGDDYYRALLFGSESCALCVKFLAEDNYHCAPCPLYRFRLGVSCDSPREDEELSPYGAFSHNNDPKPMIALLRKALKVEMKLAKMAERKP